MKILLIVSGLMLVVVAGLFVFKSKNQLVIDSTLITSTVAISPTVLLTEGGVPVPTGEDLVRLFFQLINEKRIPEAIAMMDETLVPDDSTKQAYGVTFNEFQSIEVTQVVPYSIEPLPADTEEYKVSLQIAMKPGSQSMWQSGSDVRFILLKKIGSMWKVHEIATGP